MTHQRWQEDVIPEILDTRRIIILAGARQCGKTTLAKQLTKDTTYRSLDDIALLKLAKESPRSFLKHDRHTMIIDEVQRAPDLLMAIKQQVDEDTRYGQFLLTGSANIQSLPTVRESLAGRVRKVRLHTFSQAELLGTQPNFLERAFKQAFTTPKASCHKDDILELCFRGGYPETLKLTAKQRRRWHQDYINALLERDLKDISRIRDHHTMREMVRVLYAWSSKYMHKESILSALSITKPTFDSYLSALNTLFLFDEVPPWIKTDYEYIGKRKKIFASDTGAMAALLKWDFEETRLNQDRSGKMIESFIYHELITQIDHHQDRYQLYQYRDSEKREVDFIVEDADESLLGIEVKSGSVLSKKDFRHLRFFKKTIAKERPFIGIILYTGEHLLQFDESMWAVPIHTIWADNHSK